MSTATLRVLVVGEALIDAVEREGAQGPTTSEHVGGSPANVAFGLAALGHPVQLATWFGRDARGDRIRTACESAGVELAAGSDGAPATSLARARIDAAGVAHYDFALHWDVPPLPGAADVDHVHTGSIAATAASGDHDLLASVASLRRAGATVSYDVNARPAVMGPPAGVRPRIEELVALADVVKASDEDVAWLYPQLNVTDVLRRWIGYGARLALVTEGAAGGSCLLAAAEQPTRFAAMTVAVADTVGAGDSFMAGLLSGLLDAGLLGGRAGRSALGAADPGAVAPAITRGCESAAVTITRTGAYAPRREELSSP